MVKISVLCISFNHQRFIASHIQSVLNQSFKDFELIIVDDYSSDGNIDEIKKFNDPRIKLICHGFNRGINAAVNSAFENASGEYVMFMAGDDCLEPNALEVVVKVLDNTDAIVVYPGLVQIGNNGNKIKPWSIKNRDRFKLLNMLFMSENPLYSPGMSMKREVFSKYLYPLDNSMCLHQDTQMHVKLLLIGEPKFLDDSVILYRFDGNVGNISGSAISRFRANMETEKLMDTFLNCNNTNLLKKIFFNEIKQLKIEPKTELLEFFLGHVALLSTDWYKKMWGYHKIMQAYNSKDKAKVLKDEYGFEFKDYLNLIKYMDIENSDSEKFKRKYKKYKNRSMILGAFSVILLIFVIIGVVL